MTATAAATSSYPLFLCALDSNTGRAIRTRTTSTSQHVCLKVIFLTLKVLRDRLRRSENPKFSGGACPQTPLVGALTFPCPRPIYVTTFSMTCVRAWLLELYIKLLALDVHCTPYLYLIFHGFISYLLIPHLLLILFNFLQ